MTDAYDGEDGSFEHRRVGTFDHRKTGTFDHRKAGTFDHRRDATADDGESDPFDRRMDRTDNQSTAGERTGPGPPAAERNPDAEVVKRELARLVRGDPVPTWSRRRVVHEAEAAASDVERAAAFAGDGGVDRLERAVAAAERAGDDALARRGRELRRAYAAFGRAASVPPRSRNP